jgi:hypothetical protein
MPQFLSIGHLVICIARCDVRFAHFVVLVFSRG